MESLRSCVCINSPVIRTSCLYLDILHQILYELWWQIWRFKGIFDEISGICSSALVPSIHVATDGLKASSSLKSAHKHLASERPEIPPRRYQGELIGQSHLSPQGSAPSGFIQTGFILSFGAGRMDSCRITNSSRHFDAFHSSDLYERSLERIWTIVE